MYVCICRSVTDRQVREVVTRHGAYNLRTLRTRLDACSQCGKCALEVKTLIQETLAENAVLEQQNMAA
ncbi:MULTISPECIES: (2Fe-2S)-binding protein [Methylococcus]|jgi:bacterioferritin-associated ferredoxin|uniref:Bacterioferritin-associated ferredoxin n=3 Tax=Methylococcus capsulatus TaxID=414 RepID=Q608W8_METCA|nr:(2Fe-2S)-binding protein [Methylococcus capsulatus]AAU93232.1 bacterioferritin-associated ferredoxin [Methylococcus capsulatus str. Bath]QXP88903.1 (2Fe-2S)-binding protein [Methylococcus capsulatus]QXP92338.1 (2Fe-2S)-binding protein [Methylococcus capsulatus]UQN12944.1 (2Fe-2S)-binding protein [Methylococcus capsulatus]CAI8890643.1 Bacterioferritin-associated ferredoxin [Methylococcus capsulatus]